MRNELPPRVGDFDPRCGASSLQIFAGEDLKKGDRIKMQEIQMRDWCAQKKAEKQIGDIISCITQPHLKDTFGPQDLLANLPYGAETLSSIIAVTNPRINQGINILLYIDSSI